MKYFQVDVFTDRPLEGNGLTVVFPEKPLETKTMQAVTREFRQFETIFIYPQIEGGRPVRIFTMEEELEFAGHPLLGAAAVIHRESFPVAEEARIILAAGSRKIAVKTAGREGCVSAEMNQGKPAFHKIPGDGYSREIAGALGLSQENLHPDYPMEVVTTGLPYLLVPVRKGLEQARIRQEGFEKLLSRAGARFVYVYDPESLECRTWDNLGSVEDAATGSAAGPLCASLVRHGFRTVDETITLTQGRFIGRPSVIRGRVSGTTGEVFIRGEVSFFARGEMTAEL